MAETFTYEDLYELLRKEKFDNDLQEITLQHLKKIKEYFDTKKSFLEKQSTSNTFFNSKKLEKVQTELENAKRALRDLYEKRERKVISRAIFSSRMDSKLKDTTNMFKNEELLYLTLIDLLNKNKDEFFNLFEKGLEKVKIKSAESKPKTLKELPTEEKEKVKVKFLAEIPVLMDEDLNEHGPFAVGQEAELPANLAKILLDQEKIEVQDENSEGDEAVLSALQKTHTPKGDSNQDQTQTQN